MTLASLQRQYVLRLPQLSLLWKQSKIAHRAYLNIPKDVNIYNHKSAGFARILGLTGFGQWIVVSYMSFVMYQNMPAFFNWIPTDRSTDNMSTQSKRLPLADWKYRLGFAIFSFGASCAMLVTTYMYCFRSVSSITLLKESQKVLFTTYTPIGTIRNFAIDVRNVSAIQPRAGKMTQIPLKLKGYQFHFLVDKAGSFPHPSLFDRTVGVKRDFGIQKK
ncbi:transmembrane protein 223-like [Hydractinia symbiolongicarpus]|uniref:transmembrane protein 223-like n=1 Tax=Hydractinia symbiolongicarpus TaxID=13093 RepID=UPI00254AC4E9|nr:transmembrane protein 223-like [Hydractinia symbiolongicarpus]